MDEKMMIAQAVIAVLGLIALFSFRSFGQKPQPAMTSS
jgi:Tfp pilus assembly protein PilE